VGGEIRFCPCRLRTEFVLGSENDPRPVVGILGSHAPPSEMRKQLLAALIIASCGGGIQDGKWSVGLDAQIGPQG
jgi:hypothetical protein